MGRPLLSNFVETRYLIETTKDRILCRIALLVCSPPLTVLFRVMQVVARKNLSGDGSYKRQAR